MVDLFSKLYKLNREVSNMYLIGIFSLSIPYMHFKTIKTTVSSAATKLQSNLSLISLSHVIIHDHDLQVSQSRPFIYTFARNIHLLLKRNRSTYRK